MSNLPGNIPADLYPIMSAILPSMKSHGIVRSRSTEKDVRQADVESLCVKIGVRITFPHTDEPMPLATLLTTLVSFTEFDQSYEKKLSFLDRSDKSNLVIPNLTLSKNMKNFFGLPSVERPSANALVYQCRKQLVIPKTQILEEKKRKAELTGSHTLSMGASNNYYLFFTFVPYFYEFLFLATTLLSLIRFDIITSYYLPLLSYVRGN